MNRDQCRQLIARNRTAKRKRKSGSLQSGKQWTRMMRGGPLNTEQNEQQLRETTNDSEDFF